LDTVRYTTTSTMLHLQTIYTISAGG